MEKQGNALRIALPEIPDEIGIEVYLPEKTWSFRGHREQEGVVEITVC